MATLDREHLGGKPPGEFVGHKREEAVEALEHLRSRGLVAWLEEDYDHARSVGGSRGEFTGYLLFSVDPQVAVIPNGEWTTEPHTTLDKRFKITGPGDLTMYVDYDDVDHIEVDRSVAAMIDRLSTLSKRDADAEAELEFRQRYVEAVEELLGGEVPTKPGSADLAGVTDEEWIAAKVRAKVLAGAVETESKALAAAAERDAQVSTVRASTAKSLMAIRSLAEAGVPRGQVLTTAEAVLERIVVLLGQIEDGTYARANPDWKPGS